MDHDDGIFWELTSGIGAAEAQTRATDEIAAERLSFADLLRRVPVGEVVSLVLLDGAVLRGRIVHVGSDVVRLGEVTDGSGASGRRVVRCHDIRLAAVSRLAREAGE